MSTPNRAGDAALAARLLAVDPRGLGGAALRALPGPARDAWLGAYRAALPGGDPIRRLPLGAGDERLLGGLDLPATLKVGRRVARAGLLAEADGGVLVLPSAERVEPVVAARIAGALDTGMMSVEREGIAASLPARIAVIALDEGGADERPPSSLLDRLAFDLDLSGLSLRDLAAFDGADPEATAAARARLPEVEAGAQDVGALCEAALALGVDSLRAPILALRAAEAAAALDGRPALSRDDLALAARLVLAPRATVLPAVEMPEPTAEAPPPPSAEGSDDSRGDPKGHALSEHLVAAAAAALPPGLLAQLQTQMRGGGSAARSRGEAGRVQRTGGAGRPAGARRGDPRGGARLDLVATLRAAAPWQPLRRREAPDAPGRVLVRREDFRVAMRKPRTRATAIVAVDASGSAALNRLAEAKGAVELLLGEAYVRRDRVALIAFRGRGAELLLEPTRSLARAKRTLAALPGGGASPLAAGIEAAARLGLLLRRRGDAPTLVLLTDGGANVARSGESGRAAGSADAVASARLAGATGLPALVIDISPRGQPLAREVAEALQGRYVALPQAGSQAVSRVVQAAMRSGCG